MSEVSDVTGEITVLGTGEAELLVQMRLSLMRHRVYTLCISFIR